MKLLKMKFVVAAVAVCALAVPAVVVASVVSTASSVGVKVSAKLKSNSQTTLSASLQGIPVVVNCKASTTSFVLSSDGAGLGPIPITTPTFSTCTDSLGGKDTVKGFNQWSTQYNNPNQDFAGNSITINIPQDGQTLTTSVAKGCVITVAPDGPASITGAYDNSGTLTFNNQPVPFSTNAACPGGAESGTASFSNTLKSGASGTPAYQISPVIFGVAGSAAS
jgi:hypothetical protein